MIVIGITWVNKTALLPISRADVSTRTKASTVAKMKYRAPTPTIRWSMGPSRGLIIPKPIETMITNMRANERLI